jgi:hypothetical protein
VEFSAEIPHAVTFVDLCRDVARAWESELPIENLLDLHIGGERVRPGCMPHNFDYRASEGER